MMKEEHPPIKEEPASYEEENDTVSSTVIPTISASIAQEQSPFSITLSPSPTLRIHSESSYSPPHHPHLQHHQPASQRRTSCSSSSSSLPISDPPPVISNKETLELQFTPTETMRFLNQDSTNTSIAIEETSS